MSFVSDAISRLRAGRVLQQDAAVAGRVDDPRCGLRHRRRCRERARDRNEQQEQGDGREAHGAGL